VRAQCSNLALHLGPAGKAAANVMTAEDLRELFSLNADIASDTWDCM
jgi:hypothetical protein